MGDEKADYYQIWMDQWKDDVANIKIDTSDINTQEWDDWITQYTGTLDLEMQDDYYDNRLSANDINLTAGGEEMLRVAKDGFYVRGVKVEADAKEAQAVYEAFKSWMTYAILNGEINN
jgi:hypothetical protein